MLWLYDVMTSPILVSGMGKNHCSANGRIYIFFNSEGYTYISSVVCLSYIGCIHYLCKILWLISFSFLGISNRCWLTFAAQCPISIRLYFRNQLHLITVQSRHLKQIDNHFLGLWIHEFVMFSGEWNWKLFIEGSASVN